jgi:hypothetical protein
MTLSRGQAVKANADMIRHSLASHVVHAIQGWREMRLVAHLGEIGNYEIEDAAGQRYEVRLTVTAKGWPE